MINIRTEKYTKNKHKDTRCKLMFLGTNLEVVSHKTKLSPSRINPNHKVLLKSRISQNYFHRYQKCKASH